MKSLDEALDWDASYAPKDPLTGSELLAICAYGEKTVTSKGNRFALTSYIQGIRDAEKYHGISRPTFTTRVSKSQKNKLG